MTLRAFQSSIVDIYHSETRRQEILSGSVSPEALGLAPREEQALRGIDRDRLEWFCLGLFKKTSKSFMKAFENTGHLLGSDFGAVCREFYGLYGPLNLSDETLIAFRPRLFKRLRELHASIPVWEAARFDYAKAALGMFVGRSGNPELVESADVLVLHDGLEHNGRSIPFRIGFVQSYACDVMANGVELQPRTVLYFQSAAGEPLHMLTLEAQ